MILILIYHTFSNNKIHEFKLGRVRLLRPLLNVGLTIRVSRGGKG